MEKYSCLEKSSLFPPSLFLPSQRTGTKVRTLSGPRETLPPAFKRRRRVEVRNQVPLSFLVPPFPRSIVWSGGHRKERKKHCFLFSCSSLLFGGHTPFSHHLREIESLSPLPLLQIFCSKSWRTFSAQSLFFPFFILISSGYPFQSHKSTLLPGACSFL